MPENESLEARNKATVGRMWNALYAKDWDGLMAEMSPDCFYEDVPTPDTGARGPANIVKRLRIAFDHVVRFEHDTHQTIAEGDTVIVEHTETWHFETQEKVVNQFVTVHRLRDGKIEIWRDYWDLGTLMAQAPAWWIEAIAKVGQEDFS